MRSRRRTGPFHPKQYRLIQRHAVNPIPPFPENLRGFEVLDASSRAQSFFSRSEEPALSAGEGISRRQLTKPSISPLLNP